jgi:hypothetical protein
VPLRSKLSCGRGIQAFTFQITVDNPLCIVSFFAPVWLPSSMVEQLTLNQLVRGSSPRGATSFHSFAAGSFVRSFNFSPQPLASAEASLGRRSSTVEHLFCKQAVAGSNPIAGSILVCTRPLFCEKNSTARWCNGSTNDSDSFCLGSTPSRAATFRH